LEPREFVGGEYQVDSLDAADLDGDRGAGHGLFGVEEGKPEVAVDGNREQSLIFGCLAGDAEQESGDALSAVDGSPGGGHVAAAVTGQDHLGGSATGQHQLRTGI